MTAQISQSFPEFSSYLQNDFVKQWVAEKKKVIGYYCSNMPEEIIHAAGFLPFRIRGTGNSDFLLSDAILSRFNCTFARSTLNLALKGEYNFLDGMVVGNTCDHIRRMYDFWIRKVPKAIDHQMHLFFLSLPHVFTDEGRNWVREELENFQTQFSQKYHVDIPDEKLTASIEIYKKNSQLMKQVSELRLADVPKITGTEFFKLSIANSAVRKEYANLQLEKILEQATLHENKQTANEKVKKTRARLMLVGSSVDNPEFIAVCEHAGALIVADTICTGTRSFMDDPLWISTSKLNLNGVGQASLTNKPLDKIIQRVYERTFCPRMMNAHKNRLEIIKNDIKKARIDGVILQRIEFCDLHGCENALYDHYFEENMNIPVLNLDREYFIGDTGRIRTRVEAFLEKIEAKK